jgi:hypothetical protein
MWMTQVQTTAVEDIKLHDQDSAGSKTLANSYFFLCSTSYYYKQPRKRGGKDKAKIEQRESKERAKREQRLKQRE